MFWGEVFREIFRYFTEINRPNFSTMGVTDYLRDVRGELRHVSWPSRKQTINYTIIVLIISIVTGLFLGFLDFVFSTVLKHFV